MSEKPMTDEEIIKEVQKRIPINEINGLEYLVKKCIEVSIREAIKLKGGQFRAKIDARIGEIKNNSGGVWECCIEELSQIKEAI